MKVCTSWKKFKKNHFSTNVDLIIDVKKFAVPANETGRAHLKQLKVRGTHRFRSEGVKRGHTKPDSKRNRRNTGGVVTVLGGLMKEKVVRAAKL